MISAEQVNPAKHVNPIKHANLADVVIDTKSDAVDNFFTYDASSFPDIKIGARVQVPFGRGGRQTSGYVFSLRDNIPSELTGKKILKITEVDELLSLQEGAISVCVWMRGRYYCRYIEAAKCFAPSGKPRIRKAAEKEEPYFPPEPYLPPPPLTHEQKRAVHAVLPSIESGKNDAFLIHGVTGSGKTEVYLAAAEKALALNKKVIMLVPEISLTHQTVKRFVERFGKAEIAILHSKMTLPERHDEWIKIKKNEVNIVIGARSAVFAPLSDIGLIVVDEEHESTYKSDMSPKYETVEVAVKRASSVGAVVLLGSATPSVVSSYRAERGFYKKLILTKRYNTTPMPLLTVADMRTELLKGNVSIFSSALFEAMKETLAADKQIMLFLNRRGWSSFVSCPSCGYVMRCERCNISLTYHKAENRGVCHFCGLSKEVPDTCPSCIKGKLRFYGLGTEKVEELTKKAFPDVSVARLDADNAKKRGSGEQILHAFGKRKIDILIGTQMIAKGLDFADVTLVGIVAADISLNIPDFKSPERTFQLITQVAGRAGRREERGHVIIQTYMPENYAIEAAADNDYEGFYRSELFFRKTLIYPPFSDVVQITSFAEEENKSREGAERVREDLLSVEGMLTDELILGPRPAPVAKIGEDFRYHLYIKTVPKQRRALEKTLLELKQKINIDPAAGYRIIIDVNPYSLM
jgi:primosomal protein N' (replication factor Y)